MPYTKSNVVNKTTKLIHNQNNVIVANTSVSKETAAAVDAVLLLIAVCLLKYNNKVKHKQDTKDLHKDVDLGVTISLEFFK